MMKTALFSLCCAALLACGGTTTKDDAGVEDVGPDEVAGDSPEDPTPDPTSDGEDPETEDGPPPAMGSCADDPPPGAELPAALPTYGGECPTLTAGRNTITSSGAAREFILVVPEDLGETETLPVLFLWHWIGGTATEFLDKGEVQTAVNDARFMAIIPEEKGDLLLRWPYMTWDSDARIEEEARLFDDILACAAEQFEVNSSCISSVGVSSGGLWTSQLGQRRSRLLASIVSLSGGVGQAGDYMNPVRGWDGAEHIMPALVLWGGPTDFCGVNFATTSDHLEVALEEDGHFILECIHNCSHAQPPMEPPPGESAYSAIWTFVLDHPYWLEPGASPYTEAGIPTNYPEWCAIGRGSATIREGECTGGVLGDCL
jgi:hypothetical protein